MSNKLDLYDNKILYELDKNARISASQIAKKIKLSKVSVVNRINKLTKKNIIKNFMTQVNYRLLGYATSRVYYKLQNISSEKENEFFKFLCSLKSIAYIARIDGAYDVFSVAIYNSIEELDEVLNKIKEKYGQYIKERNVLPVLNILYFGRRYFVQSREIKPREVIIRKKPGKTIKLDDIEHKLVQAISLNARIPITKLMEKLKLSKDVIHYRLKKLKKDNILQKFTINLNNEKYGNSFFKLLIKFNYQKNEDEFISKISQNKNLIRIIRFFGNWDVELDFEVHNHGEIRKIIKKIKEEAGEYIQDEDLMFVYKIEKINYYPF